MAAEQYVPKEFQRELGLPKPPDRSKDIAKAKADLGRYTGQVTAYGKTIAAYEKQLGNKKLSPRARASLIARAAAARKGLAAAQKSQGGAQTRVYETTGQWDKLLQGANRDAYLALNAMFTQMGLGSLSGQIFKMVQQGYGADTISLLLQDTKEYKARFAGNEARKKAGLPVLSPAEYLATESAYRQVLSGAGLPKGFYDNPADFTGWISGDVSPTEIKERVDTATQWTTQANPSVKSALKAMYGVDESYLVAYALDRKRALPLLQKQAAAAEIGAAALRRGFGVDRSAFENYATSGISGQMAEQGFAQIAETYDPMQAIAHRFGLTWSQREAEQELFTPGAKAPFGESAVDKGKRLRSQERAMFAGGRGSSSQGLSTGYRQT